MENENRSFRYDVSLESALEDDRTGYFNAGQDCTAATRVLAGAKV